MDAYSNADGGMSTIRKIVEDNTWTGPVNQNPMPVRDGMI